MLSDVWKNHNKTNFCLKITNFISKFSIFSLVFENINFVIFSHLFLR